MTRSRHAGVLVYAKDTDRLADFYRAVLGLDTVHRAAGLVVLRSRDFELVVHGIPAHVAAQIAITEPPALREESALKFFCPVPDLAAAAEIARRLGGGVFDDQWQGPDFIVRNGHDPEGNIFQMRQPTPSVG